MAQRAAEALKLDLSRALQDAHAGLLEWWAAIRGLPDNPLYRLLKRLWQGRIAPGKLGRVISWVPLVVVVGALAYVIARYLLDPRVFATPDPLPIVILLAAVGLFALWLIMGLYHVALDALKLLSRPGALGGAEVHLDESHMVAALSEREMLAAILASLLPRLWIRWVAAPIVGLALLWLVAGWAVRQESDGWFFSFTSLAHAEGLMNRLAIHAPLTAIFLVVLGIPTATLLLLWLVALGRSLRILWQMQLVALSLSVAQLLWIPWSFIQVYMWRGLVNFGRTQEELLFDFFCPLLILGLIIASLHFSRHQPQARFVLAASLPVAALSLLIVAVHFNSWFPGGIHKIITALFLNSLVWGFSSLALINPIGVPAASWLGVDPGTYLVLPAFEYHRLPVIVILQLVYLAICAHAARLAVFDWRHGEE